MYAYTIVHELIHHMLHTRYVHMYGNHSRTTPSQHTITLYPDVHTHPVLLT